MKEAATSDRTKLTARASSELKRIISALQSGKLDERANAAAFTGEWAEAFEAINGLASTFGRLIADMNTMSSGARRGRDRHRDRCRQISGRPRQMASGINTMVGGHIAVKKKAMACVNEFANGNFEAVLERFPGKKAFINDNIENLRANLKALVADTGKLSDAAIAEKFDTRADASRHAGDFRKIVDGVNRTLDVVVDKLSWYQAVIDAVPLPDPCHRRRHEMGVPEQGV